jgi:hypothetical protein
LKKIFKNVLIVITSFIIISCSTGRTGRIENLDRKPNEAIVFAKMNIKDGDKNITKETFIVFNSLSNIAQAVKPDGSSFIYFKLPIGKHFISKISNETASQKLPEYFITFEIPESKIYYIGDINMVFDLDYNWGIYAGVIGQIGYDLRKVDLPYASIKDNFSSSKDYILKIFPTSEEIYKSISVLKRNNDKSDD